MHAYETAAFSASSAIRELFKVEGFAELTSLMHIDIDMANFSKDV